MRPRFAIRILSAASLLSAALVLPACQSSPAVTKGRPAGYGATAGRNAPDAPVQTAFTYLDDDAVAFHQHMVTLSDPFFEGRQPGTKGAEYAAAYLRRHLSTIGLDPLFDAAGDSEEVAFYQSFEVQGDVRVNTARVYASTGDSQTEFVFEEEFNPLGASASAEISGPLVFVGYAIEEGQDDYTSFSGDADLTGKVAMLLRFEPMNDKGESLWGESDGWSSAAGLSDKLQTVIDRGAAGVILVNPPGAADPRAQRLPTTAGTRFRAQLDAPSIALSTDAADRLISSADPEGRSLDDFRALADAGAHEPITFDNALVTLDIDVETAVNEALNVGAVLSGKGDLADEYVVIGAHYDHLGYGGNGSMAPGRFGEIHGGADDNASGTAGVLLAARHLSAAYEALPEDASARSIVFLLFSGEEMGLLGSRHFVEELEHESSKVVAMLNMDMIGRLRNDALEIYGTGTAEEWDEIINAQPDAPTFNIKTAPQGAGPSDHASFYRADIPVLAFFTGLHREYHTPDDRFTLVNSQGGARIAAFVSDIAYDIATRADGLTFTSTDTETTSTGRRAAARVRLGVMPGSYDQTERGLLVGEVIEGAAAEKAGIQKDDRIVGWNGEELVNVFSYMEALSGHKAGDTVTLTVERDGETIEIPVTLEAWRGAD